MAKHASLFTKPKTSQMNLLTLSPSLFLSFVRVMAIGCVFSLLRVAPQKREKAG